MAADDAAVVVTLRANLKDYEAALKSAVRSTETAARAAEKAVSGIGKGGGASKVIEGNFKKSSQAIANDAKILQFQLNDIFSGLASGQGMRAVQVQLGQIAQQMTGASLAGGARLLGTALVGMINPLNLAIVAFGVLAGVAASYFSSSEEEAKKATDALKKQADELDELAKKYGALFPALKEAAERQRKLADEGERAIALQKELALQYEKTSKTVAEQSLNVSDLLALLEAQNKPTAALANSFNDLKKAVDNHNASVKDAKPLLDALDAIIASSTGKARELAAALRDNVVASLNETERAAKAAGEALTKTLNFLPGSGGPLDLGPLIRARAGVAQSGDVATMTGKAAELLRDLEGFQPTAKWDVNAFRAGFGSDTFVDEMGKVQQVTKDTVVTLHQANQDLARRIPEFQKTITDAIGPDLWQSLTEDQQAALTSIAYNFGRLPQSIVKALQAGDKGQVAQAIAGLSGDPKRRAKEATPFGGTSAPTLTPSQKALKNLADWNVETERRIELEKQVAQINAKVGQTEAARQAQIEGLRLAEEQLYALKKAGVEISPEVEASIRATAQALADATAASDAALAASKALTDEQKKAAEEMRQVTEQLLSSALTTFTHDLMAGKDAGEAFNDMLRSLMSQLADLAIKMLIIKPLMNSLFGTGAGTATGILGFAAGGTVGLSGQSDGRKFSPALWSGAPRFAAGGMVGLRPGEMPIIAHRGEIIVPNARRIAGSGAGAASGRQRVDVMVSASPSPLLDLKIRTSAAQAEQRAVARGPAVARDNSRRFSVP